MGRKQHLNPGSTESQAAYTKQEHAKTPVNQTDVNQSKVEILEETREKQQGNPHKVVS